MDHLAFISSLTRHTAFKLRDHTDSSCRIALAVNPGIGSYWGMRQTWIKKIMFRHLGKDHLESPNVLAALYEFTSVAFQQTRFNSPFQFALHILSRKKIHICYKIHSPYPTKKHICHNITFEKKHLNIGSYRICQVPLELDPPHSNWAALPEVCAFYFYRRAAADGHIDAMHVGRPEQKTQLGGAVFFPNSKICYGIFSPEWLWCDPAQLQHQVPDKVSEGFEGFRRRWLMRFRWVPGQMADEVPEGFGEDGWWISGGFRCRWLMRFRGVPG